MSCNHWIHARAPRSCRILLICGALFVLSKGTSAAAEDCEDALRANIKGLGWNARYSMTVSTEFELEPIDNRPTRQQIESTIRADREKFEVLGEFRVLSETGARQRNPANERFHLLADGDLWLQRIDRAADDGPRGIFSRDIEKWRRRTVESNQHGYFLDGHFPGNSGKTLSQILLDDPPVCTKRIIDGHEYLVFAKDTIYGEITLRLDPEQNCVVREARFVKHADDMYDGAKFSEHPDGAWSKRWSVEVLNVQFVEQNGYVIPVSGRFVVRHEFVNGSVSSLTAKVERSNVDLMPELQNAFEMTLPDGTILSNWDDSGLGGVWKSGGIFLEVPGE